MDNDELKVVWIDKLLEATKALTKVVKEQDEKISALEGEIAHINHSMSIHTKGIESLEKRRVALKNAVHHLLDRIEALEPDEYDRTNVALKKKMEEAEKPEDPS